MTRFWIVLSAALVLSSCTTTGRMDATDAPGSSDEIPTPRIRDSRAAAYYFY